MTKKASIELSMGFTVIIIISVVIFILSLVFLFDLFTQVEGIRVQLDDRVRNQIETLLAGDARVAVPVETMSVSQGDSAGFGVGIKNTVANEPKFVVQFEGSSFLPIDEPEGRYRLQCSASSKRCSILDNYNGQNYNNEVAVEFDIGNPLLEIEINKKLITIIAVQPMPKAPRGEYIFNVRICSGTSQADAENNCRNNKLYDSAIHKLHLNVK